LPGLRVERQPTLVEQSLSSVDPPAAASELAPVQQREREPERAPRRARHLPDLGALL